MATKVTPLPDRFGVRRTGEPDRLAPPPVVPETPAMPPETVPTPTPVPAPARGVRATSRQRGRGERPLSGPRPGLGAHAEGADGHRSSGA